MWLPNRIFWKCLQKIQLNVCACMLRLRFYCLQCQKKSLLLNLASDLFFFLMFTLNACCQHTATTLFSTFFNCKMLNSVFIFIFKMLCPKSARFFTMWESRWNIVSHFSIFSLAHRWKSNIFGHFHAAKMGYFIFVGSGLFLSTSNPTRESHNGA